MCNMFLSCEKIIEDKKRLHITIFDCHFCDQHTQFN